VDTPAASQPASAVLVAHELYRFFHTGDEETAALRGVSLAVRRGEMLAVVGPSGSGKSTLLACLAGLDEPDGGHVVVAGQRLSRRSETYRSALRARHIGMLMQSGNLIEHLTLTENVALARSLRRRVGRGDGEARERGELPDPRELLAGVGLAGRADARPSTLSGGEAARAGLAVALANDPEILLADEPTAEVDRANEERVLELLRSRLAAGGAVVVATHSTRVAAGSDRVLQLVDGRERGG
jgi:putative ABC transport system ATP-binding protein